LGDGVGRQAVTIQVDSRTPGRFRRAVSFKASEPGAALFTAPPLLACYDTVSDQAATGASRDWGCQPIRGIPEQSWTSALKSWLKPTPPILYGAFSVKHFLIQVFSGSIPMFDQRNHPSVPTMMLARRRRGRRSRMAVRPPPQAAPCVLEVRPRRRHPRMVGRGSAGADRAAGGGRLFQGGALASGGSAANQAIRQTCMRSGGGRGP
jgi:hypothetical protein